jgi:hypothetical protein
MSLSLDVLFSELENEDMKREVLRGDGEDSRAGAQLDQPDLPLVTYTNAPCQTSRGSLGRTSPALQHSASWMQGGSLLP